MATGIEQFVERTWYGDSPMGVLLSPLAWTYGLVIRLRRLLYLRGLLASHRVHVPVIVVGNITVGGTGKTPMVVHLLEQLSARGLKPGVVSRGYGGSEPGPVVLPVDADPERYGDEPVLIRQRTGFPVCIGRDRFAAAKQLLQATDVDVIVSDDGLQHYALHRDVEICVVDASRGFGSARLLPAGPMREPLSRLDQVDLVIRNGGADELPAFNLAPSRCRELGGDGQRDLDAFRDAPVHAIAGIGHPQRFFGMLAEAGIRATAHAFPDHHRYRVEDLPFAGDAPILMTEKDATKCAGLGLTDAWVVPVSVHLNPSAAKSLDDILDRIAPRN